MNETYTNGFNFKTAAQAEVSLSPIMIGREKMETADVLGKKFTVVGFDFADKFDKQGNRVVDDNGEVEQFGVVVFKEEPKKYYCVGMIFSNVCKAWAAGFGGDPVAASEALEASGGVEVKFSEGKAKNGNNLVKVDIL